MARTPLAPSRRTIGAALLAWYDRHARVLPWRARRGERPDPYRVWLSEVMLQQTTVATVGPYFARFLARWPDVASLASAPREDVLSAWAGLGYYARARNLHACAQAVLRDHGGRFPDEEAKLRALPGIGAYTAGAIAAIAFDRPALAVDGNVERVVARLAAIDSPLPRAKAAIREFLQGCRPTRRPGDFAQALMDLGATICVPRAPRCSACPVARACVARHGGSPERFPVRPAKRPRPLRHGVAFVLLRKSDGAIWLTRRSETGMLGAMCGVPTTAWTPLPPDDDELARSRPSRGLWRVCAPEVRHGFTHFELALRVAVGVGRPRAPESGHWCPPTELDGAGLPTLFRKVVALARRQEKDLFTTR